ncbi:hypothetical protein [Paenibacillus terrigena]|uniref:hypothetical protein n=1 Tax=Paenibacillus terrigena TaxID=369333 RepID=UPI0003A7C2DF|nr:hypothetical protein [Paenibacillus terrigena]
MNNNLETSYLEEKLLEAKTHFNRALALGWSAGLLAVYGAVRLVPGSREMGIGWTVGHLALFAGLVLMGVGLVELWRLGGRDTAWGRVWLAVGCAGVASGLAQAGIDLYANAVSADLESRSALFERVQSVPGVMPLVYTVVPMLLYVGLIALLVRAPPRDGATHRQPPGAGATGHPCDGGVAELPDGMSEKWPLVAVLTGAGISTDTGIPDYRGSGTRPNRLCWPIGRFCSLVIIGAAHCAGFIAQLTGHYSLIKTRLPAWIGSRVALTGRLVRTIYKN